MHMPHSQGMEKAAVSKPLLQMKPMSASCRCGGTCPECRQGKYKEGTLPGVHQLTGIDQHIRHPFLRFASGEVPDCGDKSYGESGCDFEEGIPNGKTWVNVNDTDPCTRPCTVLHEESHVEDLNRYAVNIKRAMTGQVMMWMLE